MTTKVVGIVSEKGGVGKTTVITNLRVAANLAGLDVAIIDLDPQTNAADWFDERGDGSLPEAVAIPPNRLKKFLEDLRTNGTDLSCSNILGRQIADMAPVPGNFLPQNCGAVCQTLLATGRAQE